MTAGAAIAHIERTPTQLLGQGSALHGLQVWLASPKAHEQGAGHYSHHPAHTLPVSDNLGVQIRLIAGTGFCLTSPVPVLTPTLYADVHMQTATTLLVPTDHPERALYVLEGDVQLDGLALEPHSLVVLDPGEEVTLSADSDCHLVLIGGAPLDGRHGHLDFEQLSIGRGRAVVADSAKCAKRWLLVNAATAWGSW